MARSVAKKAPAKKAPAKKAAARKPTPTNTPGAKLPPKKPAAKKAPSKKAATTAPAKAAAKKAPSAEAGDTATTRSAVRPGLTAAALTNEAPGQDVLILTRRSSYRSCRCSYLSSALESPSTRRATISCWICWVPSKMSRILESRAHFSSSSVSL